MRNIALTGVTFILAYLLFMNSVSVCAKETEQWESYALSKEERIEEIITNVIGEYQEDDNITRNEALICINQVAGLSDNAVLDTIVFLNYSDLYLYKDRINRICSLSQYNFYTYEKTLFLKETTNGFLGNAGYCFYPINNCTIEFAVELMANCIEKNNKNYIDTARDFNLCSTDMLENLDKNITISELRFMMSNMFDVVGDLYYKSDESGINYEIIKMNTDLTYYELYCNRKTYIPTTIMINDKFIEIMENKNGVYLVKLRSFLNEYNKSIEWEDGAITIKDSSNSIKVCLDDFSGKRRMFTSKSIYAEHIVWEDEWIVTDKSYTHLGEYEMINEHVYLYPYTLFKLIDYLELNIQKDSIVLTR